MMRWTRLLATAGALIAPGMIMAAQAPTTGIAEVSLVNGVQTLMRDGAKWTPHGVVQIAFVGSPSTWQPGKPFKAAYENQTNADYATMKNYGIDSVRMQVSQPAFDKSPDNPIYNAARAAEFRDKFFSAVNAARAAGLTVLISMQDEDQTGETNEAQNPNDHTINAWRQIAPTYKNDRGVMFELLNEPKPAATAANWTTWKNKHQALIDVLRNEIGAKNVLIADGLLYGERLNGAPDLNDPLEPTSGHHRIVYASHPYAHFDPDHPNPSDPLFNRADSADDINMKFATFANTHPVIVTEWTVSTNFICLWGTEGADYTNRFLHALNTPRGANDAKVGLMAFAWDFGGDKFGSAFYGFGANRTRTNWINKICNVNHTADEDNYGTDPGYGAGKAITDWYTGVTNP